MFDIGSGELLLILVAVLVFFGPKKMPELARSVGRGMREFKRAQREFTDQINNAFSDEEGRQRGNVARRSISRVEPPRVELASEAQSAIDAVDAGASGAIAEGVAVSPDPLSVEAGYVDRTEQAAAPDNALPEVANGSASSGPPPPGVTAEASSRAADPEDRPSLQASEPISPSTPVEPPSPRRAVDVGERRSRENREV